MLSSLFRATPTGRHCWETGESVLIIGEFSKLPVHDNLGCFSSADRGNGIAVGRVV